MTLKSWLERQKHEWAWSGLHADFEDIVKRMNDFNRKIDELHLEFEKQKTCDCKFKKCDHMMEYVNNACIPELKDILKLHENVYDEVSRLCEHELTTDEDRILRDGISADIQKLRDMLDSA